MANKTKGQAYKLKTLGQYGSDVAVYELSKPFKRGKSKVEFVVASKPKQVSGLPEITIWESDQHGLILDNTPIAGIVSRELADAFAEIGYTLV